MINSTNYANFMDGQVYSGPCPSLPKPSIQEKGFIFQKKRADVNKKGTI
jgi:hypothetical protein